MQKYITRFKELQIELGPYALDDQQALFRFKKGLSPQLRVFTQIASPDNFAAACKVATRNESALTGSLGA